ncbi:MAG TPA: DUF1918 domain-containing protein [Gaiellaceae bacterium]|jgi:hypothetical protein|nr:DUF1918 domain-containing protein [Gaiellaceae bacterium]
MQANREFQPQPGDVVVVHGHTTGDLGRSGVIVEVLGDAGHEHYRVRWDEEHESLFWPGSDATVRAGTRRLTRARPGRR